MATNEKHPYHSWYSMHYRESRDVIKTYYNYEDFLLARIRRNGKGHLFLTMWLCFLICAYVQYQIICIQQVTQVSHLHWKCLSKCTSSRTKLTTHDVLLQILVLFLFQKILNISSLFHPKFISDMALIFPRTLYPKLHFSLCFHVYKQEKETKFLEWPVSLWRLPRLHSYQS